MSADPEARLEPLVRRLARRSLAWAGALAANDPTRHAEHLDPVFGEVAAYASWLMRCKLGSDAKAARCFQPEQLRLAARPSVAPATADSVKAVGETLVDGASTRTRPGALARGASVPTALRRPAELTADQFRQFCQATGLHPGPLVGDAQAQAAMVFYLAVYSRISSVAALTLEQTNRLLRTLRACREDLAGLLDQPFPGVPSGTGAVGVSRMNLISCHEPGGR